MFNVPNTPVYLFNRYSPYHFNTNQRMGNISLSAKAVKSVALFVRTQSCLPQTDGRTDRHSSNVLEFCADQMSPRNIWSKIIISRCYKRIDEINIPSLRRVHSLENVLGLARFWVFVRVFQCSSYTIFYIL